MSKDYLHNKSPHTHKQTHAHAHTHTHTHPQTEKTAEKNHWTRLARREKKEDRGTGEGGSSLSLPSRCSVGGLESQVNNGEVRGGRSRLSSWHKDTHMHCDDNEGGGGEKGELYLQAPQHTESH